MDRDLTFENFVKDLGARLAAAAVAVGVFFGLGYLNRIDFLGVSSFLDNPASFFAVSFFLIGILSVGWIVVQRYRR